MTFTLKIRELDNNDIENLQRLIPEFENAFVSERQRSVREDFDNIISSGKLTMRELCKLSEWCNYPEDGIKRKYRELAIDISKILFGDALPKLHSYHFMIDDGKIIIDL